MGAGRPTKLTPSTAKAIVDAIEGGNYFETAIAAVGVNKETAMGWLRVGGNKRWEAENRKPTPHERACARFSASCIKAWSRSEKSDVDAIVRAGHSPSRVVTMQTVEERDYTKPCFDCNVLGHELCEHGRLLSAKTTTTVKEEPPDLANLRWHADRRFSKRWAQRQSVEMSGPENMPIAIDVRAQEVLAQVRRLRGELVETTALEIPKEAIE